MEGIETLSRPPLDRFKVMSVGAPTWRGLKLLDRHNLG